MPDWMVPASKAAIMERIDELSRNTDRLREVLGALEASPRDPLAEIAEKFELVNPEEKQHLAVDWFTNWWPDVQPVEPVLAEGLRVAVREAIERDLPLDCYWVCGTSATGAVEVAVCWSDRQVTVLICTPAPGPSSAAPVQLTVEEQIWLVKRPGGPGTDIVTERPRHRP